MYTNCQDTDEIDACMKSEQTLLRMNKVHQMAIILLAILETISHRNPNFKPVYDIDEGDAGKKFKQNLLIMKKIIACQRISLNNTHFVGHFGN